MTRDELLAALLVERHDQTWWHSDPDRRRIEAAYRAAPKDDPAVCAQRRRDLTGSKKNTEEAA